jgi:hypothetical protein
MSLRIVALSDAHYAKTEVTGWRCRDLCPGRDVVRIVCRVASPK